jgi:hypothetical protein
MAFGQQASHRGARSVVSHNVAVYSPSKKIGNVILGLSRSHPRKDKRVLPKGVNDVTNRILAFGRERFVVRERISVRSAFFAEMSQDSFGSELKNTPKEKMGSVN